MPTKKLQGDQSYSKKVIGYKSKYSRLLYVHIYKSLMPIPRLQAGQSLQ